MEKRVSFSLDEGPSKGAKKARKEKESSLPPVPRVVSNARMEDGEATGGAGTAKGARSVSVAGLAVIASVIALFVSSIFTDFGLAEIYRGDYMSDSISTAMQHLNKHDNSILLLTILKPLSESVVYSNDLSFTISLNDRFDTSNKRPKDVQAHRTLSHMIKNKLSFPTFLDLDVWVDENRLSFPNGNHFQISLLEEIVIGTTMDVNVLTTGAHEVAIHVNVTVETNDGHFDGVAQVVSVYSSSSSYFFVVALGEDGS